MRTSVPVAVLATLAVACTGTVAETTTSVVPLTTTTTIAPPPATDGPPGVGDRAFPDLGNGGYDVTSYDFSLSFDALLRRVTGDAVIEAVSDRRLASFSLDLVGHEVTEVTVDGADAVVQRSTRDLRITPAEPIEAGATFVTTVAWSGTPAPVSIDFPMFPTGWQTGEGTSGFMFSEPDGASGLFPVNDHPVDRADVALRVTVPDGLVVVSGGERTVTEVDGGTEYSFSMPAVAPYLIPLAIGDFTPIETDDGVVTWIGGGAELPAGFDRQGEILEFLEGDLGPYPFETLGAVVVDSGFPAALETQTLPTYTTFSAAWGAPVIAHELAHHWFGNEIALGQWDDIWLNEGFATFMTWRWLEHDLGRDVYEDQVAAAYDSMATRQHSPPDDPGRDLFTASVYERGGLAVAALRHAIGDDEFFRFLRAYVSEFSGTTVTTEGFLTFVFLLLGPEAEAIVREWVTGAELPPPPL